MKNISLNAIVMCADGNYGRISHIIINPVREVITHIVVQSDRLQGSRQRLVPFERIVEATHKSIWLKCTSKELAAMEKFTEIHFINSDEAEYVAFSSTDNYISDEINLDSIFPYFNSDAGFYSVAVEEERIPDGAIAIHRSASVRANDGFVGRIDKFITDSLGQITYLMVRQGHWDKRELTLPLSAVDRLDEYIIELNLDKKTLKSLPAIPLKQAYSLS